MLFHNYHIHSFFHKLQLNWTRWQLHRQLYFTLLTKVTLPNTVIRGGSGTRIIRMPLVCTRMSSVCHSYIPVWHPYVARMYLYVIRTSLVCHPYVTCMYSYVIRTALVCTRISSVCHSYVLVCHPYVTRMEFYHKPYTSSFKFKRGILPLLTKQLS